MPRSVEIIRLDGDPKQPTLGALYIDQQPFCFTLEPPWLDNKPLKSCIPPGKYYCHPVRNTKLRSGKNVAFTYQISNVYGRSGILFHAGNTVADTYGCILVGLSVQMAPPLVSRSREAMQALIDKLGESGFPLVIEGIYETPE